MKNARLFKIVYRLLNDGKCSAKELAEDFEVSVRTIYRDIDALSASGIPIYATPGRDGGIELMDDFVIDKNLLSIEEQANILASLQGMASIVPMDDDLLLKLSGMWKQDEHSWISIDFNNWGNSKDNKDKFSMIKEAIINHRIVSIIYLNSRNEDEIRNIHPVQLIFRGNAWYLYAFCELRQAMRLFKLNRIYDITVQNQTYDTSYECNYELKIDNVSEEVIKLKFDESVAYRIYDEFNKDLIQKEDDGSYIVTSKMPIDSWVHGYLLTYMGKVKVLEPLHLKEEMKEIINRMYIEENK